MSKTDNQHESFEEFLNTSAYIEEYWIERPNQEYVVQFKDVTFEITNFIQSIAHSYGYEVYGWSENRMVAYTKRGNLDPYPGNSKQNGNVLSKILSRR